MEDTDIVLFRDPLNNGQPNWNNQYITMAENDYISDMKTKNINDAISVAYIHPRLGAILAKDANMSDTQMTLEGKRSSGGPIKTYDIFTRFGNDSISSAKAFANMSKSDWVKNCCLNNNTDYTDSGLCGKYWTQNGSYCSESNFTGYDLLNNPAAQSWCNKNPSLCDVVKVNHCKQYPNNSECGCIIPTELLKKQMASYPNITAPQNCWSTSDCNSKTDLLDTLITTQIKNTHCPDVNSLINNQIINASGNAVVKDIYQQQQMGSDTNDNSYGNSETSSFWFVFVLIILIIVIIIGGSLTAYYMYPEWFN